MTGKEIISNGKKVIRIEAEAVSNLEKSIDENFVEAVETIYNSKELFLRVLVNPV